MDLSDSDENINDLIRDVVEASKLPAKSRSTNIKPTVAHLVSVAYEKGLLSDALDDLIDLVTRPSHLDQASSSAIVKNLYPATRVSSDVVIRVLACFGHGKLKPSLTIQALLIRWLILTYHTLEDATILSKAFPALFSLLDSAALRPQLSHLLALITRRKNVKPFRIQALLNLSRRSGNDPCLVGLLRVFKDYYPEIIVGEAVRGKAAAFKHPDPVWRERLDDIQNAYLLKTEDLAEQNRDGFRVRRPINRVQRSRVVPLVHTSWTSKHSITLEEIESAASFAQNLDKLELPSQLIAVLADPLLQKLLLLRPNATAHQRIANWLEAVLQDVIDGAAESSTLWEVLQVVEDFVVSTQTLPSVLLNFFPKFLQVWDGAEGHETVLTILSYAPLLKYTDLQMYIFRPLETALLGHHPRFQSNVLTFYTNLLHHWTALLTSGDDSPDHTMKTIYELTRHVSLLSQSLLQTYPTIESQWAVLDYYEQTLRLLTDEELGNYIRIHLPPPSMIYTLVFSSSAVTTSRLCNVLALYKKGFVKAMTIKATSNVPTINHRTYRKSYISSFNGYLMDICNCLWRLRAFTDADADSHGCYVSQATVSALREYVLSLDKNLPLTALYSLSHSPTLAMASIEKLRQLENDEMAKKGSISTRHAGPVSQDSLRKLASQGGLTISWQDYRISVLTDLSDKGLDGFQNLLAGILRIFISDKEGNTPRTTQR